MIRGRKRPVGTWWDNIKVYVGAIRIKLGKCQYIYSYNALYVYNACISSNQYIKESLDRILYNQNYKLILDWPSTLNLLMYSLRHLTFQNTSKVQIFRHTFISVAFVPIPFSFLFFSKGKGTK